MRVDLSSLHDTWDEDERAYKRGAVEMPDLDGVVEMDGAEYQYRIRHLCLDDGLEELRLDDGSVTGNRIITEIGPSLEEPADICLPILPGWGETSAQFEGDFLIELLRALRDAGYKNPKVLGVNALGRGTPEYIKNKDDISRAYWGDQCRDVGNLAIYLAENGLLADEICLIAHSMGYGDALKFVGALEQYNVHHGIREDARMKISSIINLMPATDHPSGFRNVRFVSTVSKFLWKSAYQFFKGKGFMDLKFADHLRIMFSGMDRENAVSHWKRSVPDSARKFLELANNGRRRFDGEVDLLKRDGARVYVLRSIHDRLISNANIQDLERHLGSGEDGLVELSVESEALAHAIPFKMRDNQKQTIRQFLGAVFSS